MRRALVLSILMFWAMGSAALLSAQQTVIYTNPAVIAVPREDAAWMARHTTFVERAAQGDVDLLFLGDAPMAGWLEAGRTAWAKYFAPLGAVNFGLSGDRTEHVLWRVRNGELDGIEPRLIVLLAGTHNLREGGGAAAPGEVAAGVAMVAHEIRRRLPDTRLLLLGILPRQSGSARMPAAVSAVNAELARLDRGSTVRFMDLGQEFIDGKGRVDADLMQDALLPNEAGYEAWARAMLHTVRALLARGQAVDPEQPHNK